jgi:predicted TIM-barrel fold metal-dependent hydrolase
MKKFDTHQHLLYPDQFSYSWTNDFEALQGAFPIEAYDKSAEGCDIEGSLFMEVDVDTGHQNSEAKFFSELAENPANGITGVIAKALPESPDFTREIESLRSPALKGIRRVLHTQPNDLSESSLFRRNVATLAAESLTFDLCLTQQQLAIGLELVRACPEVSFILDHCGVPSIGEHSSLESDSWKQWQRGIHALAAQPNVACKFSGITAYATPEQRNPDSLRPYLNEILLAFGSERIVWGGDWPVCNLADGLRRWSEISEQLLDELSSEERTAICVENAHRIYHL